VRFADDFIVGFQYRDDAEAFLEGLRERFAKFVSIRKCCGGGCGGARGQRLRHAGRGA
jgi:hypothetical protein